MKYFYLLSFLTIQFSIKAQDLSGYWTGGHEQTWGYYSSFESRHQADIYIEQYGNLLIGLSRCLHISSGRFTISHLAGIVQGNQVFLVEKEVVLWGVQDAQWCLETLRGELVVDSVSKKLVITGITRTNKMFDVQTKRLLAGQYCPNGDFKIWKPFTVPEATGPELTDTLARVWNKAYNDSLVTAMEDPLNRKTETVQTFDVVSDSLNLSFYDDGTIDGDTITVYYNKKIVLNRQLLTDKPLTITLPVYPLADNELVMVANNTGSIPPNTALMIFYDNGIRKEVKIDSDTRKSGAVILRKNNSRE